MTLGAEWCALKLHRVPPHSSSSVCVSSEAFLSIGVCGFQIKDFYSSKTKEFEGLLDSIRKLMILLGFYLTRAIGVKVLVAWFLFAGLFQTEHFFSISDISESGRQAES